MLLLHPTMESANSKDKHGKTAVMVAVSSGHKEVLRELVAHRSVIDVNDKDSNGRTALMYAVVRRHNSIVKLLLDQPGVKTNEKND